MLPDGASGGGGSGAGGGGNSRKRRSGKNSNRQGGGQSPQGGNRSSSSAGRRRSGGADFWGKASEGPPSDRKVRPTIDPGAVVRSLGDPPLGNPSTTALQLTAIYEEAVRAATALAAANGLLEDDEL